MHYHIHQHNKQEVLDELKVAYDAAIVERRRQDDELFETSDWGSASRSPEMRLKLAMECVEAGAEEINVNFPQGVLIEGKVVLALKTKKFKILGAKYKDAPMWIRYKTIADIFQKGASKA